MLTSDFDYVLPEDLIAQYPSEDRDGSRLLVVQRTAGTLEDRHFGDLPAYLRAGDVLVLNDSKVIRSRLIGVKEPTGARIELFLLKQSAAADEWEALARPGRRLTAGDRIVFGTDELPLTCELLEKHADGSVKVRFSYKGIFLELLERLGRIPLPPYIRREPDERDAERYQTVYAATPGSAAAPTAGLHFTPRLLECLRAAGVETVFLTLHVGLGTFRPVSAACVEDHRLHREEYLVSEQAADTVNQAKREGRRIICVGTTSVRTLESASVPDTDGRTYLRAGAGDTDIFIYPGSREFLMTDALLTNFHLPKSTLLMLVSAFYDRPRLLDAYRHAVEQRYRFFSYGDAMLIL
jgi:S-adenosylmethionine:tRNA ribosyltransferase-isomerase